LTDLSAVRALLLAVAATLATPAFAQVIYKLVDRQGRVTYSNTEPKDFDGTVTRLETDAGSNVVPSAKAGDAPPRAGASSDVAEKRRRTREDLEKKLRAAQDRVEAARKAKAEGGDPLPEELQTIQHRRAPLPSGQLPPSPNCFNATDPNGAVFLNCPTRVPQEAYFERLKKLDEELRLAEEALELAERAYRRGTD
jgi:hypothetical protein